MIARKPDCAGALDFADPALLVQLHEREAAAQRLLWEDQYARICQLVAFAVSDRDETEAIAAELLIDFLFCYVDHLQDPRAIPAYLRIMAIRRSRRHLERSRRLAPFAVDTLVDSISADRLEGALEDRRRLARLEWCLQELTPRARSVLRMHYSHDQSYSTIGAELAISKQAVGKTIKHALAALQRCLQRAAQASAADAVRSVEKGARGSGRRPEAVEGEP